MASFKCKTKDEIAPAILLTQLIPPQRTFTLSGRETWNCAFSPDDTYFAWSCGNRIVVIVPWKYSSSLSWNEILPTESRHCYLKKPIILDTGYLVWSVAFGVVTCNRILKDHYIFWKRLCFSQDLILVTGHNNGRIRIWDVQTGNLILELVDHRSIVTDLSFSPDGSLILLSASYDGTLKLWDLNDNGNRFGTLSMNNKPIYSCAWSPNAKLMISVGMDKVAYIWDMITYCIKLKLEGHHYDIVACGFSPDSCLVATASWDTRAILWDAETGLMLKCFGHLYPPPHLIYAGGQNGTWIRGLSFSPDGSHFATVADDGYLRFWDIFNDDDPEAVGIMEGALCCAYSASGQILAVGTQNGSVSFWKASSCVTPLLHLCRINIRRKVQSKDLKKLKLPSRLLLYLQYCDLD
ncbi:WD repeat and SOCS box-containing protein 1-like isoform X1 [Centruroides sculpturatus]|uniref:WD repeat and SOCS box-containing protein 1-like isoform X1 n=1 Tax=Centruroides sculpturatus TaxID=218467 RepID=UPI000C6DA624|nr:WD repeat and SOCS box-containing protein 1-like isoform X1 [Centruroides sculpturatus]XP_023228175.1 WD repeat and SOCS box-containing protein 1-like isoform X2 [Centruroides sculpturatus]XP_023228176.1 WD repeat and SOCS box-containing protein 1-like isoform X1 [Centruroides sculpturatus]